MAGGVAICLCVYTRACHLHPSLVTSSCTVCCIVVLTVHLPSHIQVLVALPGMDSLEVVRDFVHNSYTHFSSGIYWISCEQPEYVADSIKFIEKVRQSY